MAFTDLVPLPFRDLRLVVLKGVALALYSGNDDWDIEIQRAPDAAGSPDVANAETIAVVPGSRRTYVDKRPDDGAIWYYRIRHTLPQCTPGAWSVWTEGHTAANIPRPLPDAPVLDFVKASLEPSQPSDGVGRAKVTTKDPQLRITAVEYQLKETPGDFLGPDSTPDTWFSTWDTQNGNIGQDRVIDFTQDVVLQETHNSAIKVRITYTDFDGETVELFLAHSFDSDRIPDVVFGLHLFGDQLFLSWQGDEDTGSIREVTSETAMPTPADLDTGTVHAGRESDGVAIKTGIAFDTEVFVRARGYSEADGTGVQSATDFTAQVKREAGATCVPAVLVDVSQDNSTGTMGLTIADPCGRVTAVGFAKKIGAGDFGAFVDDTVAPFDTTETVALDRKHNSGIKWRVKYTDDDAVEQTIGGGHTFDVDQTPEMQSIVVDKIAGDRVRVEYTADEDANSIVRRDQGGGNRVVAVTGANFGSEEIALTDVVQLFEAAGNPATDGTGTDGPFMRFALGRRMEDDPMRPLVDVDFVGEVERADGKMVSTFTISGTAGPEGTGPISVRWRSRALDEPDTAFGAWLASPQTVEIVRTKGKQHRLLAQARDDATGMVSYTAEVTVGQVDNELGLPGTLTPFRQRDDLQLAFPQSGGIPGPNIFQIPRILDDLGLTTVVDASGVVGPGLTQPVSGDKVEDYEAGLAVAPGPVLEFSGTIVAGAVMTGTIVATNLVLDGSITLANAGGKVKITSSEVQMLGGEILIVDQLDTFTEELLLDSNLISFQASGTPSLQIQGGSVMKLSAPNVDFAFEIGSGKHLRIDDGSTNISNVAGVVVSTSAPSGDYPEGTFWAEV